MKAVIMAGGSGKRLRPITCTLPKPMVPVLNKPVIDYCIELLKKHGISDVSATLHYLPKVIMNHCGDGRRYSVKLSFSLEENPLGTAGSVRKAAGSIPERTIVISGDAVTDLDISAAIASHEKSGGAVTIVLKRVDAPTEYGVALTRDDGRIYRFLEKPTLSQVFSDLANTGIYILEPDVIERIPKDSPFDFSKDLFPLLLKEKLPINGYVTDKYWCDIGNISQYRAAQRDLLEGKCAFSTAARHKDGIWVEDGAAISSEARIAGPCYIGAEAEIGAAEIGRFTVAGTGVRIGRGSSVKRSVLMENARVRERAELRGAVLCPGAEAESGVSMFGGTVLGSGSRASRGSTLCRGALVWPERKIQAGELCCDNVKWSRDQRPGTGSRVEGYADTELTPERAVRIGAALGASFGKLPSEAAVAGDGSQQGAMLRHGVISGLVSQGTDVSDMGCCSYSAFEYGIREFGLSGGAYIRSGKEAHLVEIVLLDHNGAELDGDTFRAFSQELSFGEKLPVTWERLGIVQRLNGGTKVYDAHISGLLGPFGKTKAKASIIIGGSQQVYDCAARALLPKGFSARFYSGKMLPEERDEALMFMAESGGWVTEAVIRGKNIAPDRLMAALALAAVEEGRTNRLALPGDIPPEYAERIRDEGAQVIIASSARGERLRKAMETGGYLPELFEPEACIAVAAKLYETGKLENCLNALPCVAIEEKDISCSWKDVGRMLRGLVDRENPENVELVDGVKVKTDRGWVLVKPNESLNAYRVIAGSFDSEYARELTDIYADKIKNIREEE